MSWPARAKSGKPQSFQQVIEAAPLQETRLTLDKIYEGLAPLTVKELEAIGYSA